MFKSNVSTSTLNLSIFDSVGVFTSTLPPPTLKLNALDISEAFALKLLAKLSNASCSFCSSGKRFYLLMIDTVYPFEQTKFELIFAYL